MSALRRAHRLASFVLMWFVLSLGVAVASPVVNPKSVELVCSASGAVKVIVLTDDGPQETGASHLDCPLCMLSGAPPPVPVVASPVVQPLAFSVQSISAARIAAATAAPLPARGPPRFL
jgi:hypothetical protein